MARMKANPTTFEEAEEFLGNRDQRIIGHNTWVEDHWLTGGFIGVRYHNTIIVKWEKDNVSYFSGGWKTSTTKQRLNEFMLPGLRLYQKDFDWFLQEGQFNNREGHVRPWSEGISFRVKGAR